MAAYDRQSHSALLTLGITLSHAPGRYSRYIEIINRFLAASPAPIRHWTPRTPPCTA
jgi:hypothetical protein